jgi:hypothetical protein
MNRSHGLIFTAVFAFAGLGTTISGCSTLTTPPTANEVAVLTRACADDVIARPIAQTLVGTTGNVLYTTALKHLESDFDIVCANPNAAPSDNVLAMLRRDGPLMAQLVAKLQAKQDGKGDPYPTWETDLLVAIPEIANEIPSQSVTTPVGPAKNGSL